MKVKASGFTAIHGVSQQRGPLKALGILVKKMTGSLAAGVHVESVDKLLYGWLQQMGWGGLT